MRVWSLHPRYLDRQGLVACWRETLLAQAVLAGRTRGYRKHSQLVRFRATPDPVAAVGAYLTDLATEATARGYRFDVGRIDRPAGEAEGPRMPVTEGQMVFEWTHLMAKLAVRSPDRHAVLREATDVDPHPLFILVPGPIEPWERPASPGSTPPTAATSPHSSPPTGRN